MLGPRVPYSRRMENLRESNLFKTFHPQSMLVAKVWSSLERQYGDTPTIFISLTLIYLGKQKFRTHLIVAFENLILSLPQYKSGKEREEK